MPARILAAFIDMIVLRMMASAFLPASGSGGLWMFLLAGIYFGIGNSHWLTGSTPGKKILGLEVKSLTNSERLTLTQSFLRFLYYPGIVILLVDLPETYFRMNGTIASPWVLQLNMLLAFICFLSSVAVFLVEGKLRAGHDFLAGTIVRRETEPAPSLSQPRFNKRHVFATTFAVFLSFMLWIMSVQQPPVVKRISSHKYYFERSRPFIIAGSLLNSNKLEVVLYFNSALEESEISSEVADFLDELNELDLLEQQLEVVFLIGVKGGNRFAFKNIPGQDNLEKIDLDQLPASGKSPV